MIYERHAALIPELVGEERSVSPGVPTLRFGFPGRIYAAVPLRRDPREALAPELWYLVHRSGELRAFALTDIVSPLPGYEPGGTDVEFPPMHPRDALETLRTDEHVVRAFFAGDRVPEGMSVGYDLAVMTLTHPAMRHWLRVCCSDFFEWLSP